MLTAKNIIHRSEKDLQALLRAERETTSRIAGRVRARLLEEIRSGTPFDIGKYILEQYLPILTAATLAGHLSGYRRLQLTAKQLKPKREELILDAVQDALKALEKLSTIDIRQLEERYNTNALTILQGVSDEADAKLRQTIGGLIESGETVKASVEALTAAIGQAIPEYKVESIFRTQLQIAFAAGKYQAEQSEEIQEILWGYEYVTVGDDRVREEHEILDGVKLPKDDPFWQRFYPPNGWNCRCYAIPLFDPPDEIKAAPLEAEPDKGFDLNFGDVIGKAPDKQIIIPTDTMPKARQKNLNPAAPVRPREEMKAQKEVILNSEALLTDVEVAQRYKEILESTRGSSPVNRRLKATQALERELPATKERIEKVEERLANKDAQLEEKRKQVLEGKAELAAIDAERAEDSRWLSTIENDNDVSEKDRQAYYDRVDARQARGEKAREKIKAAISAGNETASIEFDVTARSLKGDRGTVETLNRAQNFLEGVLHESHSVNGTYGDGESTLSIRVMKAKTGRAYQDSSTKSIAITERTDVAVVIHEVGHCIEQHGEVHELAKGFYFKRIGDEALTDLSRFSRFHSSDEVGAEDDFAKSQDGDSRRATYVGRYYRGDTEIVSMGLEKLYTDPTGFAEQDPEYFKFIVGIVNGELL